MMNWFSKSLSLDHMDKKETTETSKSSPLGQSLQTVLSKKSGVRAFREFLKSEYCDENLDFWLACQEFQNSVKLVDLTPKATTIYEEFIKDDSPKQVNLDFKTRDEIRQNLQHPSPLCFAAAQKRIYSLMEGDSFTRFTQTEQYKLNNTNNTIQTDATFKPRGLRKNRVAMKIKRNWDVSQEETQQSGTLLLHKD